MKKFKQKLLIVAFVSLIPAVFFGCKHPEPVKVSSVSIDGPEGRFVAVGGTLALEAQVLPENADDKTLVWTSSDETLATVDAEGVVSGVASSLDEEGNDDGVEIKALAQDGSEIAAVYKVFVRETVVRSTSLSISGKAASFVGREEQFTATILPEDTTDTEIIWESSDESKVTIDSDGLATILAATAEDEPVVITARSCDKGSTAQVELYVSESPIPLEDMSISVEKEWAFIGSQVSIDAEFEPVNASNQTVSYSVDNEELAQIDENGILTINDSDLTGSVTVTAVTVKNEDLGDDDTWTEKTSSVTVEIRRPVASIEVTVADEKYDENFGVAVGDVNSVTASVTVLPDNATNKNVVWTVSDETIAAVNDEGVVTGLAEGTVKLTATAADESAVSGAFELMVYVPIEAVEISLPAEGDTAEFFALSKQNISLKVTPENATYRDLITYSVEQGNAGVSEEEIVTLGDSPETVKLKAVSAQGGVAGYYEFSVVLDKARLEAALETAQTKYGSISAAEITDDVTQAGKYLKDSVDELAASISAADSALSGTSQTAINNALLDIEKKTAACEPIELRSAETLAAGQVKSVIYSSDNSVTTNDNKSMAWGANGWSYGGYTNIAPSGQEDGKTLTTVATVDGRNVKKLVLSAPSLITFSDIVGMNAAEGNYMAAHLSLLTSKPVIVGFMKYGDDGVGPYLFRFDPLSRTVAAKDDSGKYTVEVPAVITRDDNYWYSVEFNFSAVYRDSMISSGGPLVNMMFVPDETGVEESYYLDNVFFVEREYSVEYFETLLTDKIAAARGFLASAHIGDGSNQYPQSAADTLANVLTTAESASGSGDKVQLKEAIASVENGLAAFKLTLNVPFIKTTDINAAYFTANTNIASGATYTSTSGTAALAFDGDLNSRWESAQSDPQVLTIDLSSAKNFNRIAFKWEGAYSSDYEIAISDDGEEWETVASVETSSYEEFQLLSFNPVQTARYIRFTGNKRGTVWGHSFFEMGVYDVE